jgi:hypothetical protein
MRIRIFGLLAVTAALCSACNGPGSPEWCKGVIQGTIKATEQEMSANEQKCAEVLMKELMSGKPPGS